jgi:hypothetical protein
MANNDAGTIALGCVGLVVLFFVLFFASAAFYGWLIMILIGILHGTFGWPATTIGFWPTAVGLGAIFGLLTAALRTVKSS